MRHFSGRALAVLALAAVLFTACADDDKTTTAAPTSASDSASSAPASGSVTVYSGRSESLVKPILDMFTADTGIKVEFRAGDSGALGAQILTEGDASPADVFFSQDAGALGAVSKASLLEALPSSLTSQVPEAFAAEDGSWVGVSGRVRVVVYNPTLAPSPPKTIDEVVDPQWKGKIGFAPTNASWQSFVTALRVLRGDVGAKEWLEKFAANEPKPFDGNGPVRDAVNDGQIALGLVNHYYLFEKISKEGADTVVAKNQYLTNGDVGGLVNVAGVAVLRSSDNKPAALALVEYLLSEKAQKYFAEKTFEYPLTPGVEPVVEVPSLDSLKPPNIDLSDLDSIEKTQDLLAEVGLLTK
jgi:iron(III) transport system substrate-binding protein